MSTISTDLLNLAVRAAERAGEHLKRCSPAASGERIKENVHSIVTTHDIEAQQIIIDTIREVDAASTILSEEVPSPQPVAARPCWVVDPIDGTSYFVRGLQTYSISIAFIDEQGLLVGVVFCPGTGEMFNARRGYGAHLNGRAIRASTVAQPDKALVTFSHRFLREMEGCAGRLEMIRMVRSIRGGGSCAQELAYLATGRIDGVVALRQSLWDYAAAQLIVEEAGGRVSNAWGVAPSLSNTRPKSEDIVATNGLLHEWCLQRIAGAADGDQVRI